MSGKSPAPEYGNLLPRLRHGLQKSRLLAEHLAPDPLVGSEARALLSRIEAIQQEIEILRLEKPDASHSINDPFWSKFVGVTHETGGR